ncbi:MAG: LPS assembly lipoprotein LptE [Candidatus Anammoxibacter sp.]
MEFIKARSCVIRRNMEDNTIKRKMLVFLSILFFGALIGCSYSSRSILKQNVNSVYIPIFDNKTFRRGLEFGLTKALKNEIMFKTQLRIAEKDNADSLLSGEIVDFAEQTMIVDSNDNIVESRIFIVVDFIWRDLRTGRILAEQKEVIAPTEFIVGHGETIETAKNESYVDLAERIVDMMSERW